MSQCDYEKNLIDVLDGSLSDAEMADFQKHLQTCGPCNAVYDDLFDVHKMLMRRVRPLPPRELQIKYEAALEAQFCRQSSWDRFGKKLTEWSRLLFPDKTAMVRFTGFTGILLVGVILGRFVLAPNPGLNKESFSTVDIAEADTQFISHFLIQSEIWLMEMSNLTSAEDFEMNRDLARKLLAKYTVMEQKIQKKHYTPVLKFLSYLELVLLETSGTRDQDLNEAFREIREAIEETSLVDDVQRFRNTLTTPAREEA